MQRKHSSPISTVFVGLVSLTSVLTGLTPAAAAQGTTKLISAPLVYDSVNHYGTYPSISADGRYVVFTTYNALAPGDIVDSYQDVYVKDLLDDSIERVSVNSGGQPANAHCSRPVISPDGRYVSFDSYATNLVPGDTNDTSDVFVHDRVAGMTERISVSSSGAEGNSLSYQPSISGDGRFVAFTSEATNLTVVPSNANGEVYVHDRISGATESVSVSSTQPAILPSNSYWTAISYDGRYVAFTSNARYLLSDLNGQADVYVRDRQTGTLAIASADAAGATGDGANNQTISADGRFVAFHAGDHLVAGDINNTGDVYVKDMQTGALEWVSVEGSGAAANGWSYNASISADGRFVAFSSFASNLVAGDTNGFQDIFIHDRQTHTTELVSDGAGGMPGNADSGSSQHNVAIAISADGHAVAFTSAATNLVANDFNSAEDIFVRARQTNQPPVAVCVQSAITVQCSSAAGAVVQLDGSGSFDPDGDAVLFHWDVSNLSVVLANPESATPSGTFPVGVTMATLTVADGLGGVDTCDVVVTVQDSVPPEIMCSTDMASLWPPDHTMRAVRIMVVATDACQHPGDILPLTVQVRSDEPDNAIGNGDGNTTGDVNFQDGYAAPVLVTSVLTYDANLGAWVGTLMLRAERDGNGDGRAYTIDALAFDSQNNVAQTSCVVVVPHDKKGGNHP